MIMILNFDEYIKLNEAVTNVKFYDFEKVLTNLGWKYRRNGVRCIFTKDGYDSDITIHLDHGDASNSYMKIEDLINFRSSMIKKFIETQNPSELNVIPWNKWNLKNPFKFELKDYDSQTGLKKSEVNLMNNVEIVDKLFKNVCVIKNQDGEYNLCKSESDKRPLLDRWYPLYEFSKKLGVMCLGYNVEEEDGEEEFGTHHFEIKDDGTLGKIKRVDYVVESVKK